MVDASLPDAVAAFGAAVDGLLSLELSRVGAVELTGMLSELERHRRRLAAVDHRLIAELELRGVAGEYARASTVDLLTTLLRVTPAEAKARVAQATDLGPRRTLTGEPLPPILPRCADATKAGLISAGHVTVIARCLDRIPAHLANQTVDAAPEVADDSTGPTTDTIARVAERFLLDAAAHQHPAALARTADALLLRLDPDGHAPRDADNERHRHLTLREHPDGTVELSGRLTPTTAEAVRTVLDPLAAPAPAIDGTPDPRTAGQRRHDALHELALHALRSGDLPAAAGIPVTILATTTLTELHTLAGLARTGHGDLWPVATLLDLAGDAGDAAITPVLVNDAGGVLAYGRTRRLASRSQRLALTARDKGCSFPQCDRPAAWTEVHHITPWADGGGTDLDNMCLLCGYHHREFTRRGWTVRMHPQDHLPEWIPPPFIDPHQQPRRNTTHHTLHFDYRKPELVG